MRIRIYTFPSSIHAYVRVYVYIFSSSPSSKFVNVHARSLTLRRRVERTREEEEEVEEEEERANDTRWRAPFRRFAEAEKEGGGERVETSSGQHRTRRVAASLRRYLLLPREYIRE